MEAGAGKGPPGLVTPRGSSLLRGDTNQAPSTPCICRGPWRLGPPSAPRYPQQRGLDPVGFIALTECQYTVRCGEVPLAKPLVETARINLCHLNCQGSAARLEKARGPPHPPCCRQWVLGLLLPAVQDAHGKGFHAFPQLLPVLALLPGLSPECQHSSCSLVQQRDRQTGPPADRDTLRPQRCLPPRRVQTPQRPQLGLH